MMNKISIINNQKIFSINFINLIKQQQILNQIRYCSTSSENDDNEKTKKLKEKQMEERDRRIPVELETSIRYMQSDAFKETYKNYKIWELFRRNFKGQFSPVVPRLSCVNDDGFLKTTNPCVICRDRYLVLHQKNIELLKHFISPQTGYVYPNSIICLCFDQYEKLCVAVQLAKNYGYIDFDVPIRLYDYNYHYHNHNHENRLKQLKK